MKRILMIFGYGATPPAIGLNLSQWKTAESIQQNVYELSASIGTNETLRNLLSNFSINQVLTIIISCLVICFWYWKWKEQRLKVKKLKQEMKED